MSISKKKTVFVGLSGGVDSAVSAALLKQATPNNFEKLFGRPTPKGFRGYEVVGVFIKTWHPDFLECNEEEERHDAMRVAAHLDIPFLTFDFEDVYKKEVADYMIGEYKAGRTPNPDVMCNKEVKFGAFLKKALSMGADFVATGHYAQVGHHRNKKMENYFFQSLGPSLRSATPSKNNFPFFLFKNKDISKDQSYFLWTLKQDQLKRILFPVGHLKKNEVRKLAKKFGIPVATKKDSQGICFLGAVDLKEFLKHYIKEKKGDVVLVPSEVEGDEKKVIGYHNGVVFHTLGERHGFVITQKGPNDGRYYVVGKDIKKNILFVSQSKSVNYSTILKNYRLKDVNWIFEIPNPEKNYTAQVRYHGEFLSCKIKVVSKTEAVVDFVSPVVVASGQSCVVYDGSICLGGGVVV
jgi:tRNA-specific 2-thiouridylase